MYPDSLHLIMYPDGAASLQMSFTLPALNITISGTCNPPALAKLTTVVVVPFSSATVWNMRSPVIPMTFLSLGTSVIPVSSTFKMWLGLNSISQSLTHFFSRSKNLSTCTGFAAIALAADKFCAFFFLSRGFLSMKPFLQALPALFLVGEKPGLCVFVANS